jgi:flagellin
MSIANTLRSNGRGLQQAQRNASQASSLLQIADGATGTISSILDRMKELATESATSNVTTNDRAKINSEFTQLKSEVDRIVGSTVYQGSKLLDGTFGVKVDTANTDAPVANISLGGAKASSTFTLEGSTAGSLTMSNTDNSLVQTVTGYASGSHTYNFDKLGVSFSYTGDTAALDAKVIKTDASTTASFRVGSGAISDSDNLVSIGLGNLTSAGLGLSTVSLDTIDNATSALTAINTAVSSVNTVIGDIGAAENRFDYASDSVASLYQNSAAAESVIRDADMAQEYTAYSKLQILQQAGTAMLAQANSSAQSVLTLLRG